MPKISVVIPAYNLETELSDMLDSLLKQSFCDYEAIIVNDGSSDRTEIIAEEFSDKDKRFRFISQKNQGVSSARNRGIECARGDYLIFFDGDDFIPADSLKNLYDSIIKNNSDMAVGIMETYSDGTSEINKASKNLAEKDCIFPQDINFIKTWSQCNKLYRKDFITDNNIKFLDVKVAEDGHFLYQVLSKSPVICGCNAIVYRYMRKPFWQGYHTASKNVDEIYLYDRIKVYNDMLQISDMILSGASDSEREIYKMNLVSRFIKGGIIQAFYRRIWRCDDSIENRLSDALKKYINIIDKKTLDKICSENWDIPIEDILKNNLNNLKKSIYENPEVSVALSSELDKDELNFTVRSFYNQEFPSFEILVDSKIFNALDDDLKDVKNMRMVNCESYDKNIFIEEARGKYILFIDFASAYSVHSLKKMCENLKWNNNLDFVSAYFKGMNTKNLYSRELYSCPLCSSEAIFGYSDRAKRRYTKINGLDNMFSNKLFKIDSIKNFIFTSHDVDDVKYLYRYKNFEKMRNTQILTYVTDDILKKRASADVRPIDIKINFAVNRILKPFAGKGIKKFIKG